MLQTQRQYAQSTTYRLRETINGAPAEATPPDSQRSLRSRGSCLNSLRARSYYWTQEGFLMLHQVGALVATDYSPASGEMLVLTFEGVTGK